MTTCPSCQQSVDDDFGMVTCLNCGHVFLIGFQEATQEPQDETREDAFESGEDVLYALNESEEADPPQGAVEEGYDSPVDQEEPLTGWSVGADEDDPVVAQDSQEESAQSEPKTFSEEISEFAESPVLPEGAYEYQLRISTSGSQDIFQNLRQAIEDVGLVSSDYLKGQGQEMVIVGWVGPVTAHSLVRRLRSLGLLVDWEQRHALKEGD